MRPTVVVVGAGIAGLATSFEILERSKRQPTGVDLLCLEAGPRPGGQIQSTREGGFLYEWAANGFLDNAPATITLVRRLGLEQRLLRAREASARRFILRGGRLREVPASPGAFALSGVLPLSAKLRLLAEPLIPRRTALDDESIEAFATRRVGGRAAAILVDALVAGVFAGDPRRLSLAAAFPKLLQMETEHGSLTRAMLARRKAARAPDQAAGAGARFGGTLYSFIDGMQELPDALARRLGGLLRLEQPVDSISDRGPRGFRVHLRHGAPIEADALILACPAPEAAALIERLSPEIAERLREIRFAPLTVVHLGYRGAMSLVREDGFGFLVPRDQGARVLGALWSSSIFESRAPADSRLVTVMAGGARAPEIAALADKPLLRLVREDLQAAMGLTAEPAQVRIVRHPRGIPQYEVGHPQRLAAIDRALSGIPGLWLTGSSLSGVSVNLGVQRAAELAEVVLEHLARRDPPAAP